MRGNTDGALCGICPFAKDGSPAIPVTAEFPPTPAWVIVGDGPGRTEVQLRKPFQGSQQIVDKMLMKVGRRRDELVLTYAHLCGAPQGLTAPERERASERAMECCKPRLQAELAQWPGMPVLTLGALAARAVIPKAALDAIDRSEAAPKAKKLDLKRQAKLLEKARIKSEKALAKDQAKEAREIAKIYKQKLKELLDYQRGKLRDEMMAPLPGQPYRRRKAPTRALLDEEIKRFVKPLEEKAKGFALSSYARGEADRARIAVFAAANPAPKKPKKIKPAKFSDICSTLFDVDVDGTGVIRPVVPTIHPMVLLGGGAAIGGTHTPDLAFINLYYDASKINSLSKGVDVRLKLNVETEVSDPARTLELLLGVFHEAVAEGAVALDLETYVDDDERHTALMMYVAKIRCIGLATKKRSIAIMWDQISSMGFSILQLMLMHPGVTLICHHGIYDRTVLKANGFSFPEPVDVPCFRVVDGFKTVDNFTLPGAHDDSLYAHHAAFPGNAHRLQAVTSQLFGVSGWKSEFRNAEETPEKLATYCAKDTGATRALAAPLTVMVKRTKTEKIYALDRKMADIAGKMHLHGMPVCRETNSAMLRTFSRNVDESRAAVEKVAADPTLTEEIHHQLALEQARKPRKSDSPDVEIRVRARLEEIKFDPKWRWKLNSPKHIAALLLAADIPLERNKTGAWSTKKEVLEALVHYPLVRDIMIFRDNDKLRSTFIWQIFDRFNGDGQMIQYGYADAFDRIHPSWTVHKISGRWASSSPVVSNVPKDRWKNVADEKVPRDLKWIVSNGKKGETWLAADVFGVLWRRNEKGKFAQQVRPNLRSQIRAPDGRMFVGFDFGQVEARVIALISADPFLCWVFANGLDIHRECAKVVFSEFESMSVDDQAKARDHTKNFEFGAFYGGSVETLWKTLLRQGYTFKLEDIQRAVDLLMAKMAGVVRWQRAAVLRASTPPYEVRDAVLGRRRTFPLGQVEPTEAMNSEVQPTAAAIMNLGMARADDGLNAYREAFAIAQIHDAAVFECWEEDAAKLAVDVKEWFTQEHTRDGLTVPFPVDVKIGRTWAEV